ncbi:MAG: hypothetical protein MJ014_01590 [Methanocorpusculum sp.]|nr:hypothetical protein [Methanocorpusculum sp.]
MNKRIFISILLIEGCGDYAAMKDFADLVPFTAMPAEDEEFHRFAHAHVDEIRAIPTEKLLAIKAAVQSLPERQRSTTMPSVLSAVSRWRTVLQNRLMGHISAFRARCGNNFFEKKFTPAIFPHSLHTSSCREIIPPQPHVHLGSSFARKFSASISFARMPKTTRLT